MSLRGCCFVFVLFSEYCDDCAGVFFFDELLDLFGLESINQRLDLVAVFVALLDGDDVCIGLCGVAGSILDSQSVGYLEACGDGVVTVDNCHCAVVAVFKLCGDGFCLDLNNVVALVVHDVQSGNALFHARVSGQGDQAFLLQEQQSAGLVAVVGGDDDGCACGDGCDCVNAVAVEAEGLVVDQGSRGKMCAVCFVEAIEVRGVLEVVCVQIALLQSGVGQNVIVLDNDVQGVALLFEHVFDLL